MIIDCKLINSSNKVSSYNKNLSTEIYDEVCVFSNEETEVKYTKRVLGNGDYIHYYEFKNTKDMDFEISDIENFQAKTFDTYYKTPEFDNRYGYNKSTGPHSLIEINDKNLMISKVYYYKQLSLQYDNGKQSNLLELDEENTEILLGKDNICIKLKEFEHSCSFFIIESQQKLFNSDKSLEEYFEYYFDSVKNNCVEYSFFMLPSGLMSKLPYSIEPFTKDGYGYSLHHSSKRELIDLASNNNDRFFYNMLLNSYMQLKLYATEHDGVYLTTYTSTWIKNDFHITAPYVDTRLNEYLNLTLMEFKKLYKLDFVKSNEKEYLDFLISRMSYTNFRTENGIFYPDYFDVQDKSLGTHASLNHQVAIMNFAFDVYAENKEDKYKNLIIQMLNFLRDTCDLWIDFETGDLYYSCYYENNELKMKDKDYVFVTLHDLIVLYENCENNKLKDFQFLRKLIDIKIKKIKTVKYSSGEKIEYYDKIASKLDEISYLNKGGNMFDVKGYWDNRYKSNRDSGSGSYGRLSQFKAEVINAFVKENDIKELFEFGSGDGNNLQYYNVDSYYGVDISEEALKICKEKYDKDNKKHFLSYEKLYNSDRKFECTMSLDVIYHLSDDDVYYKYLEDLFGYSSKYVIVYSNSTNYHFTGVDKTAGYVLFRDFNKDVENLYPEYSLINIIPNLYPFSDAIPNETSFSDFYIYEKNTNEIIDKNQLFSNFYLQKQLNKQNVMTEVLELNGKRQDEIEKIIGERNSYISKYEYERTQLEKVREERNSYISKYEYERTQLEKVKEERNSYISKYEYERTQLEKVKEERNSYISKYEYEKTQLEKAREERNSYISKFEYERTQLETISEKLKLVTEERNSYISKFVYEQKMLVETKNELNLIKSTKYYKIMKFNWKINSKVKRTLKKIRNKSARTLYGMFKNNATMMGICKKINNKFGIIKDTRVLNQDYVENIASKENNKATANIKTAKNIKDLKVAVILDEFSYNSFKDEFIPVIITPDNWKEVMEREKPDIFFCESAWSGVDSKLRPWKGKIYASENFKTENRTILIAIIDYCNKKNIPTIFWNKEDPTHYTDRVHDFVKTALMFDHIFTTAEECVELYKNEYGHKSVYALPFATNPKMFNPLETTERSKDIVFAGSWYKQHPARCEEMEEIFDKIISSGKNLKIYDRHSEVDDENHEFPEKYKPYIHKAIPFTEMPNVYKESEMALNINTVVNSKTMFARRIFELASSNTLVLSNDFKGKEMFDGNIIIVDDEMDFSKADECREKNLYNVLANHTYSDRFRQILNNINYNFEEDKKSINVIFKVTSDEDINEVMKLNLNREFNHTLLISENIEHVKIKDYYERYSNQIGVISEHYIKNYGQNTSIDDEYFVVLKDYCEYSKIEKAIVHFTYLPHDIGVSLNNTTDKYTVIEKECKYSCVLAKSNFINVITNDSFSSKTIEI